MLNTILKQYFYADGISLSKAVIPPHNEENAVIIKKVKLTVTATPWSR